MELEPPQQGVELRPVDRDAVHHDPAASRPNGGALLLQHGHERAEFPLLILSPLRIAKQVHGPRQVRGESLCSERHGPQT